jgi:hypothetical protein
MRIAICDNIYMRYQQYVIIDGNIL